MSSSQGELRFPLEDRYLARARVSDKRFDEWKAVAQKDMDAVLSNPRSWYYRPSDLKQAYRPVYEQDAIRGFVKAADNNSDQRDLFGLAHIEEITLDDLVHSFLATTTADQRAVSAQLHGPAFLDAAVLRVAEAPHANDPFHFVGLKWLAFGSPAPAIIAHRDQVYFECSGTTYDISNRKVLFLFQRAFPFQTGELAEPDNGCARCAHSLLWLFRMEGGGVLLQGVSTFTPQASAPSWVATRVITETFDAIKNFAVLPDARAIIAAGILKKEAPSKGAGENKACVVCLKKFGMLRARLACRACGQSICKLCVTTLSLFNDEALVTSAATVLSESFCLGCVRHAKSQRQLETLSATLTKTNISSFNSDAISSTRSSSASHSATVPSSPFDSSIRQPQTRDGLTFSIGLQVGVTPLSVSESGSDTGGGSNRSLPIHAQYSSTMDVESPHAGNNVSSARSDHSMHLSATESTRARMFEQMNESIRQQEELLMVIQQERAKMRGQQQQPVPPVGYVPSTGHDEHQGERFQELP